MGQKSPRNFLPECGVKLTHKLLCRLIGDVVHHTDMPNMAALLDAFEGSRVNIFVVPYSTTRDVFFELRCGDIRCKKRFSAVDLKHILDLAPFIAACAGQATPEPAELEKLEARIRRIEEQLK